MQDITTEIITVAILFTLPFFRPGSAGAFSCAVLLRCEQIVDVVLREQFLEFQIFWICKWRFPRKFVVETFQRKIQQFCIPIDANRAILKDTFEPNHTTTSSLTRWTGPALASPHLW